MGFLHSCRGGGAGASGVKYYTIPIDNTSFVQSDSMFKANIVHSLNTNNLIVQVDDGKRVENVVYKYLNDNETGLLLRKMVKKRGFFSDIFPLFTYFFRYFALKTIV